MATSEIKSGHLSYLFSLASNERKYKILKFLFGTVSGFKIETEASMWNPKSSIPNLKICFYLQLEATESF